MWIAFVLKWHRKGLISGNTGMFYYTIPKLKIFSKEMREFLAVGYLSFTHKKG